MNYKLIEDKNGTIVLKEKRYKMSKLEYTKDDLIDMQNDYDLLYKKLDHYNKIINTQALEIARLKENKNKVIDYVNGKIKKMGDDNLDELWLLDEEVGEFLYVLGDKEYYCVLIKPKKYQELLEWERYTVKPMSQEKQVGYAVGYETNTIYNLPYEITNYIDEDIKMVTKEEYKEYQARKMKDYDEFMKNYEPDYMWRN